MKRDAVIVCTARTPIAKYRGDFAKITIPGLGALSIQELVHKSGIDPRMVDEVILGSLNGSDWGNAARCAWLEAGFPLKTSALTIDRQCGSAVNAVALAAAQIQNGTYDIVIAGGAESYSQQPIYIQRPQRDFPDDLVFLPRKIAPPGMGHGSLVTDMIGTADRLAKMYGITREECDAFALKSHLNAAAAWEKGYFSEQIFPVTIPQRKGDPKVVNMDACVRGDSTMESLGRLPVMLEGGVTTAGNSSPRNDGSAVVLVMARETAKALGYKPLAVVRECTTAGVDPGIMGIGPVASTRKMMDRFGYKLDDFELIELNEAFAAQSLAVIKELGVDPDRVNVEGGAIAIGHPTGASGGMLVARLIYALKHRNLHRGMVTFCCGGGQGISLILENEDC